MESENERSASEHSNFYGGTDYEKLAYVRKSLYSYRFIGETCHFHSCRDSTDTEVNEVEEQRGNVVVRLINAI